MGPLEKKGQDAGHKLFAGFKVADFSAVIAGSLITKTLASYGAEVIRIEGRAHLDIFRRSMLPNVITNADDFLSGYSPWANRGPAFPVWNTGKKSVALNLSDPRGVEIAKKFVAWADIVVENFAGGVMKRMGLGYEELRKVKPDLIMLSSCMQGQTGPHANHPGYGTQLVNLAGFGGITGWPEREPATFGPYTDYVAPRFSLLALLAAVDYRRRTGKGQYLDVSQYETAVQFMAPLILDNAANGRAAERVGNYSPYAAPHGVYPCKATHLDDRWCAIGVYTEEDWQGFCKAIGYPAWTRDPKFNTLRARRANRAELDCIIESWTSMRLPLEVERRMREVNVPVAILKTGRELAERNPPALGRSPYGAPHGAYRCHWEDRWVAIAVSTEEEWRAFCKVIGSPAWTRDPRFATLAGRLENCDELDRLVGVWTMERSPEEVMASLQAVGVAAGVVETGEDMMEKDPQLQHRRLFWDMESPETGKFRGVAPSFTMARHEVEMTRSPLMGEHNEYALKELLGMTDAEIEEMVREGVVE